MNEFPIGIDLIEQFVEPRYEPGGSAMGIALGEAMDKQSGKYYNDRMKAYQEHFDHVFKYLVIKPAYKALHAQNLQPPMFEVKVNHQFKVFHVDTIFYFKDEDKHWQISLTDRITYDRNSWNTLKSQFQYHMEQLLSNTVNSSLWQSLTDDQKTAIISVRKGEFQEWGVNSVPFAVYEQLLDMKLIEKSVMGLDLTTRGHDLIRYALRQKIISL